MLPFLFGYIMPQAAKKKVTKSRQYNKQWQPHNWMYCRKIWKDIRKEHLKNNPLCVECLKENKSTPANQVDHIEPHEGIWNSFINPDNLQSLCKKHHSMKTYRETLGKK